MTAFLALDPLSPVPVFRQIVDSVRASIASGLLAPGELLPSVRALAEDLRVNPNTVHRAFAELDRAGLVRAERGRGMVVLSGKKAEARMSNEQAVLERFADALRLARASGLSEERMDALFRRAQRDDGGSRGAESGGRTRG